MPQPKEENIAIDLRRWQGISIEEIRSQNASFPIEAGDKPFEKRISVLATPLKSFAKLLKPESSASDDLATTEIYNWAQKTKASVEVWTKTAAQEEILKAMSDFIEVNPGQIMVWISPKTKGIYLETRIGIYQVINVNSEKYLFFRTLCSSHSFEDCLRIASKFKANSPTNSNNQPIVFTDPEILRAEPISVTVPGNNPIDYLASIIKMPAVFEAIRKGNDIKNNLESIKQASQIITDEVYREIQEARSFSEQVRLGQYIEEQLQRRSGTRLLNGTCGILYSSIGLTNPVSLLGFSLPPIEGGKRIHCGKCGKTGYFTEGETCPYDKSS